MEHKRVGNIEEDITQLETKLETLTEEMNHQVMILFVYKNYKKR